jgi:Skp family chaperone for outer membrane proteins
MSKRNSSAEEVLNFFKYVASVELAEALAAKVNDIVARRQAQLAHIQVEVEAKAAKRRKKANGEEHHESLSDA